MQRIIKKIVIIVLVLFICVPHIPMVPECFTVQASAAGLHDMDNDEFEYPGNPKLVVYDKEKGILEWAFDSITRFIDYILGFQLTFVKILFVGLTEQVENLIDGTISTVQNGTTDSNDDEKTHYTIEDLVYNRIPLFDVNVFTDTPGGKTLPSDSPVLMLRNVIATWYVTFRNMAFIALLLILIYTGIKMALTQIAEKKADAKRQLIGWVKAIVLLFVIHLIIYFILQISDWLVSVFASGASSENILYNTIKTRAYDFRFSVGLPGMIMYIALFIFWIRFLLIYIRRLFKVFILIAIAPFTVTKYAIDNANSKGRQAFDNWLSNLVSNVILQVVHALEYTILMGIAVDIANKSIMGFIIALIFMSQMLKLDKHVLSLIKFSGKGGGENIEPLKEPIQHTYRRVLEGYVFTKTVFGPTVGLATGAVRTLGSGIDEISDATLHVKPIKKVKNTVQGVTDDIGNAKDNILINTIGKVAGDQKVQEYKLRIASRQKNAKGKPTKNAQKAKKILKKYQAAKKAKYTAKFGTLKGRVYRAGAVVFGTAALVHNTEAGLTIMTSGMGRSQRAFKEGKDQKKIEQETGDLQQTIKYVNQANKASSELEKTYRNYTGERKNRARKEMEKMEQINGNSQFVQDSIERYMKENDIDHIDNNNIETVLKGTLKDIDSAGVLTEKERTEIIAKQKDEIAKKYGKNYRIYRSFRFNGQEEMNKSQKDERSEAQKTFDNIFAEQVQQDKAEQEQKHYDEENNRNNNEHNFASYDTEWVSHSFSRNIENEVVSDENKFIADRLNEIKDINAKLEKIGQKKIIHTGKFIKQINRPNT